MKTTGLYITASVAALISSPALAQTDADSAQQTSTAEARGQEIIVTAQRREQVLLDVPQAISVLGGEELERQQARSFIDYAKNVPGLNVTQTNPGQSRLILRGINTGSVGSTVAVYVDDVPFGSSGSLANGAIQAGDFDTFDVARIEVLKGPQGTLYGSNALGGVLKFVTNAPRTDRFEVRAQAGVEDTKGGETGYLANGVVNIPLGDALAFRASGFFQRNGGYIDAVGRAGSNINGNDSYGGRASLLFEPTEAFSARLSAIVQNLDVDSASSFDADPRTLRPVNAITGARQSNRTRFERIADSNDARYRLYSGTLAYDFGPAALTSVTSYATQKQLTFTDISTNAARGLANVVFAPTAPNTVGLSFQNNLDVTKFTQELRLASSDSDRFEWLVGGYYTREHTTLDQEFLPFTLATQAFIPPANSFLGTPVPFFVIAVIDARYREYAGFANATVHFGDRFDITGGLRYSHNKQTSSQLISQLAVGAPQLGASSEGVLTWAVAPRFELSDHASIYARAAKGYRPGGPNFIPVGAPAAFPREFNSDSTISYELGLRAETVDRTFGVDVAAFYVDWDDILIFTTAQSAAGPAGVNANGRRARSYGVEGTASLRPVPGFSVVASAAYTHARLRDDAVPISGGLNLTGGLAGDKLPFIPTIAANVSADYEWQLSENVEAFVGGNIRLSGDQPAGFEAAYRAAFGRRLTLDGYNQVDLRAGVNFGGFTVQAYAKNLFDNYALVSATYAPFTVPAALGGTSIPLARASTIRPRTLGLTAGVKF